MITKVKSDEPIRPLKNVSSYSSWTMPSLDVGDAPSFLQPADDEESEVEIENNDEPKEAEIDEETLNTIKQQARDEGFEAGRQEGLVAAQKEIAEKSALLTRTIELMAEPSKICQEKTQQALLELSFSIAKQIVRRELKQDPTQLIAIIREALRMLPIGATNIVISLHPEDEAFVSSALSINVNSEKNNWQIVSNPSIERGSCQVVTENSTVDASIDKQIAVLFSKFIGGQRAGESNTELNSETPEIESNDDSSGDFNAE